LLDSLQWREKDISFGSLYPKESVIQLLESVNPITHFTLFWDAILSHCSTVADDMFFPHQQALIAATHYNGSVTTYGSYESRMTPSPKILTKTDSSVEKHVEAKSEETPILLVTGASFSVTPHIRDFVS
jgi:hypothetical protein